MIQYREDGTARKCHRGIAVLSRSPTGAPVMKWTRVGTGSYEGTADYGHYECFRGTTRMAGFTGATWECWYELSARSVYLGAFKTCREAKTAAVTYDASDKKRLLLAALKD